MDRCDRCTSWNSDRNQARVPPSKLVHGAPGNAGVCRRPAGQPASAAILSSPGSARSGAELDDLGRHRSGTRGLTASDVAECPTTSLVLIASPPPTSSDDCKASHHDVGVGSASDDRLDTIQKPELVVGAELEPGGKRLRSR